MFSDQQLRSYLDESLPAETMAQVEQQLRGDEALRQRLANLVGMREAGVHAVGEIWRRQRLTCQSRQQLGAYLLGAMEPEQFDYVKFHLDVIGCRFCTANLEDLKSQQAGASAAVESRRRRYFQTSAGYLRKSIDE